MPEPHRQKPVAVGDAACQSIAETGDGLFAGIRQYKFMRAFFGLSVSSVIAVTVTLLTRPPPSRQLAGLVWGSVAEAIRHYKGRAGSEGPIRRCLARPVLASAEPAPQTQGQLPPVRISAEVAARLGAVKGDLVYVCDRRWWLGGLHSSHAVVSEVLDTRDDHVIEMGPATYSLVVTSTRGECAVCVERIC